MASRTATQIAPEHELSLTMPALCGCAKPMLGFGSINGNGMAAAIHCA